MKRSCLRSMLVWASRIKYRRGYGVHSPFAYSFFRDIIFETLPFYAFGKLDNSVMSCPYKRKTLHIFYRIVNSTSPGLLLDISSVSPAPACYMTGILRRTRSMVLVPDGERVNAFRETLMSFGLSAEFYKGDLIQNILEISESAGNFDLVHIGHIESKPQHFELSKVVADNMSEKGVLIVDSINKADVADIWEYLVAHHNSTAAFDLYDIGILFFDKKLNKEYYKVNY